MCTTFLFSVSDEYFRDYIQSLLAILIKCILYYAGAYQGGAAGQVYQAPPGYTPVGTTSGQHPSYMQPGSTVLVQPQPSVVIVGGCPACRVRYCFLVTYLRVFYSAHDTCPLPSRKPNFVFRRTSKRYQIVFTFNFRLGYWKMILRA